MEDIEFPVLEEQKEGGFPIQLVLAVVVIVAAGIFVKRQRDRRVKVERSGISEQPEQERLEIEERKPPLEELPDDLKEVLEILKSEGGRITQKELRKRLGYSEAKMSLIVADLERRGLVEKIKKGRGNVIFLKD